MLFQCYISFLMTLVYDMIRCCWSRRQLLRDVQHGWTLQWPLWTQCKHRQIPQMLSGVRMLRFALNKYYYSNCWWFVVGLLWIYWILWFCVIEDMLIQVFFLANFVSTLVYVLWAEHWLIVLRGLWKACLFIHWPTAWTFAPFIFY